MTTNGLRFVEARELAALAKRLERTLRTAPKALLGGVPSEDFLRAVKAVTSATADVRRAIENLEKLLAS